MNKPYAATVLKWLRDNGHKLGGLTSQDARALLASVQIVPLWGPYERNAEQIAAAWGACVREMQPSTRQFAFHAVAHVANWDDRFKLWRAAGFDELPSPCYRCKFESQTTADPP
jgi:hypothetical protein